MTPAPPDETRPFDLRASLQRLAARPPQTPREAAMPDQNTDLERRVLAHERILQFLIADLVDGDPPLLDRMALTFAPQGRRSDAHEHTDAEDYAEQFIRQLRKLAEDRPVRREALTEAQAPDPSDPPTPLAALAGTGGGANVIPVGVRKRSGVWEVRTDQGHHGDYRQRADAIEAALTEVGTRIDAGNVVDFQVEGRPFAIARRAAELKG